ncbi:hypothetical protein [Wenzhouxiangella sp. EGI_FJ10305]|uniref:hypothetical protein n=1 Tax=Wenzhouxiangella sp. EGI_FJ10305 TaxID=3243768 RepID=UPI0035DAA510
MPRWAETTSSRCPRGTQRGFSLLELVIVIILVILLFLVAFDRLMPLRGQAEAAHVASTIGTLRSALGMATAERVVDEGISALPGLAGENPMALLDEVPGNYIGEIESADSETVPLGSWYFERDSNQLGYRVRYPQYLQDPDDEAVHLAWRVTLGFNDKNENGAYDPDIDSAHSIGLRSLHDRTWQNMNVSEAATTSNSQ